MGATHTLSAAVDLTKNKHKQESSPQKKENKYKLQYFGVGMRFIQGSRVSF